MACQEAVKAGAFMVALPDWQGVWRSALRRSQGFSHPCCVCCLQVACQEAVKAGAFMVAKEALYRLHAQLVAQHQHRQQQLQGGDPSAALASAAVGGGDGREAEGGGTTEKKGAGGGSGLSEANALRVLAKCTMEDHASSRGGSGAKKSAPVAAVADALQQHEVGAGSSSVLHKELAKVFKTAADR